MSHLRPALVLMVLFTILTGFVFPLGFTVAASVATPGIATGSLVSRDGHVIGSSLLGQPFKSDKYFFPRPSATTDTDPQDSSKTIPAPYNAANSGASNLGATQKALIDRVHDDAQKVGTAPVPGDSVTTSASGLDPDISPDYADRQIARVAAARKLPEDAVRGMVAAHTDGRVLGVLGEKRVNVLELNLALDAASGR